MCFFFLKDKENVEAHDSSQQVEIFWYQDYLSKNNSSIATRSMNKLLIDVHIKNENPIS